jgi:hypothetical protein
MHGCGIGCSITFDHSGKSARKVDRVSPIEEAKGEMDVGEGK